LEATNHSSSSAGDAQAPIRIKVIGVGGAGTNAVARLDLTDFGSVQLAAVNTDMQALNQSVIPEKLVIGRKITRGLGTGGDLKIGKAAAEADRDAIADLIRDMDLIILVVGMGGGTGSAAASVIAQVAARTDALVLAFATLPFSFEVAGRKEIAESCIGELRQLVHGLIPLPNDILLQEGDEDLSVLNAFAVADRWIGRGIHSLCAVLLKTGLINQDLNSLRSVFRDRGGKAVFGTGIGNGGDYVKDALADLFICPLLHLGDRPGQLDRILVNVIGGADLGIAKVNEIVRAVSQRFGSREDVVFGAVIDPNQQQSLEICVLGKAEMDTAPAARPESAPRATETTGLGLETEISQDARPPRPVHSSKLSRKRKPDMNQDEFTFLDVDAQRGYFEKTDRNDYKGEDLDVPTYLRRGIRIKIK
jgi:cell division protein FtsZ